MGDGSAPLPPFGSSGQPTLQQLVDYFLAGLFSPDNLKLLEATHGNAIARGNTVSEAAGVAAAKGAIDKYGAPIAGAIAKAVFDILQLSDPITSSVAKVALDSVLGQGVARAGVPGDVGHVILQKLTPASATVEPSLEPAAGYMSTMVNLEMETWLMGFVAEVLGDAISIIDVGGATFRTIAELRSVMTQVFGGGRLTRRVLAPLIDDAIVAPAKRQTMQTYRPSLLKEAEAVRAFLRGRWTQDRMTAELAQQGWSDERIAELLNSSKKFLGAGDVRVLVDRGSWTPDQGLQHLKDQGWDEDTANASLRLEGLRIFIAHEAAEAAHIISAYETHAIEQPDFLALLQQYVEVDTTRALYQELGELRRSLHVRHLTSSQVAACVKAKVLAVADYVDALTREGYDEEAIAALELLLRTELDAKTTLDEHKAQAAAAAQVKRDAAAAKAAAKVQEVEQARALKAQGSFAQLSKAVVRGLIPASRLEQILTPQYDADTVSILMQTVAGERAAYVAQQAKAADAAKRAANKNLNTAQLDQLFYDNQISLTDYEQRLEAGGMSADDVQLLANLASDTKKARDAAAATRAQAAAKAKAGGLNLAQMERLVVIGARPMSAYDAFLTTLGYDDAARAGLEELVTVQIQKAQAAAQAKAAAAAKLKDKPLTEAEAARAVVLGTSTLDQYQTFLVSNGFAAEAVAVLVADTKAAADDAAAARAKRAAAAAKQSEPALPLSTYVKAASLGLITPAVYQARLAALGYSPDDIAIDLELLSVETADANARQAKADLLAQSTGQRGLTLHQEELAVKAGVATIDDYRARAASLNYSADEVDTLVSVLQDALTAKAAATAAKKSNTPTPTGQTVDFAALEDQVRAGTLAIAAYQTALLTAGLPAADAALIANELQSELAAPPPAGP